MNIETRLCCIIIALCTYSYLLIYSDATADLRSTQQRLSLVEQDLHQSFDQIAGLERELERTRRAEKQNAELKAQLAELVAKAKQDKKDAEEGKLFQNIGSVYL